MGMQGNAVQSRPSSETASTERVPQRLVVLEDDDESQVVAVLHQYQGAEVSGKRIYRDLVTEAQDHPGQTVAAEWLGTLGWTRFLWCRR
jgi:hypothetical protein